jgi:hypothetical protein
MPVDGRIAAAARRAVALAVSAAVVAGCAGGTSTLDGAIPIPLRVSTTATTVDVDAPGWLADVSAVYVCSSAPPPLPDSSTDRMGWTPGRDCHDYGRHPSADGLRLSLPVADLRGEGWPAFRSAGEWYLLVLDLDGDLVSTAIRTRFHAPGVVTPS